MKEVVIEIWIPSKKKYEKQGKACYINEKPVFIANMTANKWWKNYTGYAIAKSVLDGFAKLGLKPTIIFKREDLGTYYTTNRSMFQKKGVLVAYGGHPQYVLPIKNWTPNKGKLQKEPRDLPVIKLKDWLLKENKSPTEEAIKINTGIMMRLKKEFKKKYL